MKTTFARFWLIAALIASLAGCGGGGGGGGASSSAVVASAGTSDVEKAAAANLAANDPTQNAQAPWNTFAALGVAPVTVQSPPVVNFAVLDSSGKHVPGLKLVGGDTACNGSNVRLAIAKFDGANWQSLISRQRYAADSAGKFAVVEATTDPLPTATITNPPTALADPAVRVVGILQEDASKGYYTYHFATDVTTPLLLANAVDQKNVSLGKLANNGNLAVKDNATIHRVAVQLCFVDPQTKATVKVNPYIDFTLDAAGSAHPVTDGQGNLTEYRKVADRSSCNECHQTLAAHGGGRIDPNFCVACHNPGSTDYKTKNSIDFKLMIHKFHMGKRLTQDYLVQDFVARKKDAVTGAITGVDYPQDQRNCVKCHDGSANAVNKTKDGDNWRTAASKNACLACHDDYKDTSSTWYAVHQVIPAVDVNNPDAVADSVCAGCHGEGGTKIGTATVHAVPEWTFAANYQYNIHAVTWNADRTVSVEFSVSNPTDGSTYNIKDAAYQYTTVNTAGTTTTRNFVFGRLALLFGWGSGDFTNAGAVARGWGSSCTTVVASGTPTCDATTGLPPPSSGAGSLITRGQPVSISAAFDSVAVAGTNNHFKVTSTPLPTTAAGTGAVALQGRVGLMKDANSSYSVPVKNVVSYFAIGGSGSAAPRRTVVSADKCNACHGRNINSHGHGGNRTEPEVCVICHNGNNVLDTTVAGGAVTVPPESADFKRLIHAIHKAQGANYPVMPSTQRTVASAAGSYIGFTGIKTCTACHVGDSYQKDLGATGSSTLVEVNLATDSTRAQVLDTDGSNNPAISPKASTCSSCHDDVAAKEHMIGVGGAAFSSSLSGDRTVTQADIAAGRVSESCDSCHVSGGLAGVATKHGLQ